MVEDKHKRIVFEVDLQPVLLLLGRQDPGRDHLRQVDVRPWLAPGGPVVLLVEVLEHSLRRKEEELRDEPALLLILTCGNTHSGNQQV